MEFTTDDLAILNRDPSQFKNMPHFSEKFQNEFNCSETEVAIIIQAMHKTKVRKDMPFVVFLSNTIASIYSKLNALDDDYKKAIFTNEDKILLKSDPRNYKNIENFPAKFLFWLECSKQESAILCKALDHINMSKNGNFYDYVVTNAIENTINALLRLPKNASTLQFNTVDPRSPTTWYLFFVPNDEGRLKNKLNPEKLKAKKVYHDEITDEKKFDILNPLSWKYLIPDNSNESTKEKTKEKAQESNANYNEDLPPAYDEIDAVPYPDNKPPEPFSIQPLIPVLARWIRIQPEYIKNPDSLLVICSDLSKFFDNHRAYEYRDLVIHCDADLQGMKATMATDLTLYIEQSQERQQMVVH